MPQLYATTLVTSNQRHETQNLRRPQPHGVYSVVLVTKTFSILWLLFPWVGEGEGGGGEVGGYRQLNFDLEKGINTTYCLKYSYI